MAEVNPDFKPCQCGRLNPSPYDSWSTWVYKLAHHDCFWDLVTAYQERAHWRIHG